MNTARHTCVTRAVPPHRSRVRLKSSTGNLYNGPPDGLADSKNETNWMNRSIVFCTGLVIATGLLVPSSASAQATPYELADLVGAQARGGDQAMHDRGYVHIDTQKSSDRSYSNWWNGSRRECVTVATQNGRYASITESPGSDCNQTNVSSGGDDDAVAAIVAVGAAALIGALAASDHKSHHHETGKHGYDAFGEQEFERGYRDGLYAHHFDDFNGTEAYQRGYRSGVGQRTHNSSYRDHTGRYSTGYQPSYAHTQLASVNNMSVTDANRRLNDWGFREVDQFGDANTGYGIWYNRSTGQCVQQTIDQRGRRTVDVRDIGRHPACR